MLAQIVADALGLKPTDIRVVTDLDTARDAWSIASGNYSSRFAAAVGGAAHLAALKIKAKLGKIAASQLNVAADEIEFAGGRARARGNPDNAVCLFAGSPRPATGRPAWCPRKIRRCARPCSGRRRN